MDKKKYPIGSEYYTLYEVIGQGVSASVHRALCIPFNENVAIKILDFERDNCDLNNISREAQTMMLVDHPNVLKSHCSFVSDHNLWVVMPYMAGGSCLHILKAAYPDGFEEVVIATILREALKGLEYLHHHGHIHRDVKAGNILIDARGGIKLGDFGVSACLFDSGDRQRTRNTFVGTPCWMAPEVMEQLHGYDFRADIWSFGITALELAHGHAPFSKYAPMKVLLMTLQNAPPGLDYERDRKFSRSFKQMIAICLVKDPSKRPTAKKLLKHSFFKKARSNDYIVQTLLDGLPDLGNRVQALKRKEEDMLAQKKMPDGQKEEISQNEYKRGISGWNFNLEDMKAQASLIQDIDDPVSDSNQGGSSNFLHALDSHEKPPESQEGNNDHVAREPFQPLDRTLSITSVRLDKSDDDSSIASPSYESRHVNSSPRHADQSVNSSFMGTALQTNGKPLDYVVPSNLKSEASEGNTISPDRNILSNKVERDKLQDWLQSTSACNGPMTPRGGEDVLSELPLKISKSSASLNEVDEKTKPPVVQQRGRFKVTSENVDLEKVIPSPILQKSHSMQVLTQHSATSLPPSVSPAEALSSNISSSSLFPTLNFVLKANIVQRDYILSVMKSISSGDTTDSHVNERGCLQTNGTANEKFLVEAANDRERELIQEITDLQWRLICAQKELQKCKTENAQV